MVVVWFAMLTVAGMIFAAIVAAVVLIILYLTGIRDIRRSARVWILGGIAAFGLVFALISTPYRTEYETPADTGRDMGSVVKTTPT